MTYLTILFLLLAAPASAEYVLYDAQTQEVVDISPWNDAVVQPGQVKEEIPVNFDPSYPLKFYKISNGRVELDAKKYNEWQIEQASIDARKEEIDNEKKYIENKIIDMAVIELEKEGKSLKHVDKIKK